MKEIKYTIFIQILLIAGIWNLKAQESFRVIPESSILSIGGTSNLHDWEMNMKKFKCDADITVGNPSVTISSVSFIGESSSILSDNSIMDNKAHDALKTDKYPVIRFSLTSADKIPIQGGAFSGTASGELTLAGSTKKISIPYSGKVTGKDRIIITGTKKINMTEFGIKPPTAMLGALKTGDEVTINFTVNLKQL